MQKAKLHQLLDDCACSSWIHSAWFHRLTYFSPRYDSKPKTHTKAVITKSISTAARPPDPIPNPPRSIPSLRLAIRGSPLPKLSGRPPPTPCVFHSRTVAGSVRFMLCLDFLSSRARWYVLRHRPHAPFEDVETVSTQAEVRHGHGRPGPGTASATACTPLASSVSAAMTLCIDVSHYRKPRRQTCSKR